MSRDDETQLTSGQLPPPQNKKVITARNSIPPADYLRSGTLELAARTCSHGLVGQRAGYGSKMGGFDCGKRLQAGFCNIYFVTIATFSHLSLCKGYTGMLASIKRCSTHLLLTGTNGSDLCQQTVYLLMNAAVYSNTSSALLRCSLKEGSQSRALSRSNLSPFLVEIVSFCEYLIDISESLIFTRRES